MQLRSCTHSGDTASGPVWIVISTSGEIRPIAAPRQAYRDFEPRFGRDVAEPPTDPPRLPSVA